MYLPWQQVQRGLYTIPEKPAIHLPSLWEQAFELRIMILMQAKTKFYVRNLIFYKAYICRIW